jgi:hypothetical protein
MSIISTIKGVAHQLIDVGITLIALAIVLSVLVGGTLPFFGSTVDNLMGLVSKLGSNGVVGLVVLGIILALFSNESDSTPTHK